MSDLRAQVVEAMAQALCANRYDRWELTTERTQQGYRWDAEAALGAALRVLGETEPRYTFAERLLAVLRP